MSEEMNMPLQPSGGWQILYEKDLPAPGRMVEVMFHNDSRVYRGEFKWNGFWMLEDSTIIGGGRVARWRPIAEEPVGA